MNSEHDEDLRKARLYLTLDEFEMANVRAEHEKYERRKAAMRRGDMGSPIGPLTFAPLSCVSCSIKLTTKNHATAHVCVTCQDRKDRLSQNAADAARFEEKRVAVAKLIAARPTALRAALTWGAVVIGTVAAALVIAWAANKFAWWLGGGQ